MSAYLGNGPGVGSWTVTQYIAIDGQTTFSGTDSQSYTLSYEAPWVMVFKNGRYLPPYTYTATSGTSVVLAASDACVAGDEIMCISMKKFQPADALAITQNGADIANKVTFQGNLFGSTGVILPNQASPSTPAAGKQAIYVDSAKRLRSKDDAGFDAAYGTVFARYSANSGDANIVIPLPSDFDEFLIKLRGWMPATTASQLNMDVSIDGGSTYLSSVGIFSYQLRATNNTSMTTSSNASSTSPGLTEAASNANPAIATNGYVRISPGAPSLCAFYSSRLSVSDGTYLLTREVDVNVNTGARLTHVRFKWTSGNITSGKVMCIGYK